MLVKINMLSILCLLIPHYVYHQVDVVGPHYTSDGTIHHKFLLPTLMDAMFKLHKCGFETCAIVCDGASSNLTMIKELTGSERKAYGYVY